MSTITTTKIFKNGNSRAIRIPKATFSQALPGDTLVIESYRDRVVLRKTKHVRQGWTTKFAQAGDDIVKDKYGTLDGDEAIGDGLESYDN